MSVNYDVIVIFKISGQFGANRKADSERMVWKTYIFIKNNLYLAKTEGKTKKPFHTIALSKGTIFYKKY